MNLRARRGGALLALLVATVVAGCTKAPEKEETVLSRTEAETTAQINRYAEEVAALIGAPSVLNPKANASECEGRNGELSKEIYFVQGVFQLPVPVERHLDTLHRTRDAWRAQGFTVDTERTYPDGRTGQLVATNPDGYRFSLMSGDPPTAFALLVHSPCYRRG